MPPGASENGGKGGHSGSTSYDIHGLGQLVGFLATTDSQRQRGQGQALTDDGNGGEHAAGNAKDRSLAKLEKKGKAEEWYLEMKEVEMLEWLAQGQCAQVYKARWRGIVAVAKVLKGSADYQSGWTLASARADLVHEVSVLSHLRHPNLVLFLGACIDRDNIVLLNEFMDGGNLEEHVLAMKDRHRGVRARLPRKHVARWGLDLAQAITFLHNCNPSVIHRDLKPANLLLSSQGCLKIGDFGLSSTQRRVVAAGDSYVMTGRTGTIRYMAPEAMEVDRDGNSSYNEKVDCYSAAMILWYMCMADPPFGDLEAELIMAGARGGLRPELASVERRHGSVMARTIESCWEADARQRYSAEQLLEQMRQHLVLVETKQIRSRSLPGSSVYRWASSAASHVAAKMPNPAKLLSERVFGGRGSKNKGEQGTAGSAQTDSNKAGKDSAKIDAGTSPTGERDAQASVQHPLAAMKKQLSGANQSAEREHEGHPWPGDAPSDERGGAWSAESDSSPHKGTGAGGLAVMYRGPGGQFYSAGGHDFAEHHAHPAWLRPLRSGSLDGTHTTTGTWSLDTTTNTQKSLDNTAQTTTSVFSDADDWFSQVTDERLQAARGSPHSSEKHSPHLSSAAGPHAAAAAGRSGAGMPSLRGSRAPRVAGRNTLQTDRSRGSTKSSGDSDNGAAIGDSDRSNSSAGAWEQGEASGRAGRHAMDAPHGHTSRDSDGSNSSAHADGRGGASGAAQQAETVKEGAREDAGKGSVPEAERVRGLPDL